MFGFLKSGRCMKVAQAACKAKDLSAPELKTAEGAVALSQCMDLLYKKEEYAQQPSTEEIFYGATLLMKWLVSLPADVFRKDCVGIPAILERIRKTYDGTYQNASNPISLPNLSGWNMIAQWAGDLAEKTWQEWLFPFEIEKVKALRENGYSLDWIYFNTFQFMDLPERPWCEALRFYPPKQFGRHTDFVWAAADKKREDVLLCMKEVGFLTEEELYKTTAYLTGENRALFLSVWYKDRQGASPEVTMVEELLGAEKPDGETIAKIINGSTGSFRGKHDLLQRAIACAPVILLSNDRVYDKQLYETAFEAVEQYYHRELLSCPMSFYYTHNILEGNTKGQKELWLNAFKTLFPSEEEKRAFLKEHPYCALNGGFYTACPKKLKDDLGLWVDLYVLAGDRTDLPVTLKKNQAFLRMCQPVKPVNGFSEYFVYDSEETLQFALQYGKVNLERVPDELKSYETIWKILENCSANISRADFSLYLDEEFVVGAAAYQIDVKDFFKQIDKSLRKRERVWKAWVTKESISKIWADIPLTAKKTREFIEHLLAIGKGVSFDSALFAQAWNKFPDLAEALETQYVAELAVAKDYSGSPFSEADKRRIVGEIPDESLREHITDKLFK